MAGRLDSDIDTRTRAQIDAIVEIVHRWLGDDAIAAFLYGSAVSGGLKPTSDVDVFVISARATTPDDRRRLIGDLLPISGSRAAAGPARPIELTIVVQSDIRPWRYPPRLDFQYGDWWRHEFEAGDLAPWTTPDPDLAVLLATVLLDGRPLFGPPPAEILDPVPHADLDRAMVDGLPALMTDLDDDTRNIILTLARIWMTLATGRIRPKDVAADWALARLPTGERPVLARARAIYLGEHAETWDDLRPAVRPHADRLIREIEALASQG